MRDVNDFSRSSIRDRRRIRERTTRKSYLSERRNKVLRNRTNIAKRCDLLRREMTCNSRRIIQIRDELLSQISACVQKEDHVLTIANEEITQIILILRNVSLSEQQR